MSAKDKKKEDKASGFPDCDFILFYSILSENS